MRELAKVSNNIYEGHPECSFKMLKNEALKAKKVSIRHFRKIRPLKKAGLDPLSVDLHLDNNSTTKIDDVLDSMVLFITALRIYEGNYLCLEKTETKNNDDNGKIFI